MTEAIDGKTKMSLFPGIKVTPGKLLSPLALGDLDTSDKTNQHRQVNRYSSRLNNKSKVS